MYLYQDEYVTLKPLIDVRLLHDYKSLSFKQCNFTKNHNSNILIYILIRADRAYHKQRQHCSTSFFFNDQYKFCEVPVLQKCSRHTGKC